MKRSPEAPLRLPGGPRKFQFSPLLTAAEIAAVASSARSHRRFEGLGPRGLLANADHVQGMVAGDVDGDGDLDLVTGNESPQNLLWLNDGSGTFTDATSVRFPIGDEPAAALALDDLDMDGDPDLLVGNDGRRRLELNLLRQLDVPDVYHIGRTFELDVYPRHGPASPGAIAFPLLSTGSAHIPFAPFGTIGIDLDRTVALPSFAVPQSTGMGSLSLPVPNQPGLVGVPLYVQTLLVPQGVQARLTNVTFDTMH